MKQIASILFGIFLLAGPRRVDAQQVNPRVPPPPPPAEGPAASTDAPPPAPAGASPSATPRPIDPSIPPPPPSEDSAPEPPAAPSGPVFDPLHAQRSLDIGTFYLKKGSYDAAIDRFLEAANYQPTMAMPWKLLGETYERKHEYSKAVEAYNKYLRILPRAPDAAKIRKNIADLEEKVAQDSPKRR